MLGLALLAAWWAAARSGRIPAVFLPGPVDVARRLWLGLTRAGLASYAWVTLREALLGCLTAAALALPLAWALFRWRLFSRTVLPYVTASQVYGLNGSSLSAEPDSASSIAFFRARRVLSRIIKNSSSVSAVMLPKTDVCIIPLTVFFFMLLKKGIYS